MGQFATQEIQRRFASGADQPVTVGRRNRIGTDQGLQRGDIIVGEPTGGELDLIGGRRPDGISGDPENLGEQGFDRVGEMGGGAGGAPGIPLHRG